MSDPRFLVVNKSGSTSRTVGNFTLVIDMWDDYHFKTSFQLRYATKDGVVDIGYVKIASRGMVEYDPHTVLPTTFTELGHEFFSLGQGREYYEELSKLPNGIGTAALRALRDVASDPTIFERMRDEPALSTSLMREIPQRTVETQFRRIAAGHAPLTPYRFSFTRGSNREAHPPVQLEFGVHPGAVPPTNVQVLIGPNGVGKSSLLRDFLTAAIGAETPGSGEFRDEMAGLSRDASRLPFANVVHVAFSAFDAVQELPAQEYGVKAHLVGLSAEVGSLEDQFISSLRICAKGPRRDRWLAAISTLAASDAILSGERVERLLEGNAGFAEYLARQLFSEMSSGHKIVVLTVSRLVELVEEQSLILLDEPETHLHPPLLSALTRAVSDLAIDRNGVAIVATHSPVVLQEVPRSCAWVLRRAGDNLRAWKLDTESFGESVSRLTAEVFHLDVQQTGYHQVLKNLLATSEGSAQLVLSQLDGQLGGEGRFVLHALARNQDVPSA